MAANYSQWASRIRVPAGFVIAAIYLLAAQPAPASLLTGVCVALAGLGVRAWAAGVIEKNARLAVSGPYAHTRNPLYLGSAIAALGFSIAAGKWWLLVLLGVFFAAVYIPVMRREQARMQELFGTEYAAYAAAVPLLLPRLTAWQPAGASANTFTWQRYLKNHEYRAATAFGLIIVFLLAKLFWLGRG
jgi:protein-S-isoprenylcysteine O-methyltransferase Ste14